MTRRAAQLGHLKLMAHPYQQLLAAWIYQLVPAWTMHYTLAVWIG
jgi:hypothetical protein